MLDVVAGRGIVGRQMSTKQISPGEISVGMFVTVISNEPFVRQEPTGGLFGGGTIETVTTNDRSGMGDVHTVLAIELPYIVVRRECKYESSRFEHAIDTRRTRLMELKRDYVETLCPYLKEGARK